MNRITEITKRDILDLFQNGLEIDEFFQTRTVTYNYYGRLEEIDFLKRLYDLERMPSFDSRFANAEQDIWQHTVMIIHTAGFLKTKDSIYKMVAMKYI